MTRYAVATMMILGMMACGRGPVGAPGPQGERGDTGSQGDTGTPGTDATPVTVVKLCPGVTIYPSKFVEIAFCIDGTLYGTYSTNGGFSTELPPGTYGSKGVNSSCNFTILPNCKVLN